LEQVQPEARCVVEQEAGDRGGGEVHQETDETDADLVESLEGLQQAGGGCPGESGSGEASLLPRPLRTVREACASYGSSLHKRPSRDAAASVRRS
jgi:hypothetical protein